MSCTELSRYEYHKWILDLKIRKSPVQTSVPESDTEVFGPTASGSVNEVRIRIWLRIRILPSSSKNNKKYLDFYCVVTSLILFIFGE
jgi:hypothetical protein